MSNEPETNSYGMPIDFHPVYQRTSQIAGAKPFMFVDVKSLDTLIRNIEASIETLEEFKEMQMMDDDCMYHATGLHIEDLNIILTRLNAVKEKMNV